MKSSRDGAREVFLTCPYGQVGGGMGSIMQYLSDMRTDPSGRFVFKRLELRGGGSIILSPLHLAVAVLRIFVGAASGRLAVVHLNLAERGSVYRKGVLLHAARLVGVKVLLHLHAAQIIAFHQTLPRPGRALLRGMFRSADHVVVLGDLWRRWVVETFGVAPQAVSVVNNGVPATPLPRVPRGRGPAVPAAVPRQSAGAQGDLRPVARPGAARGTAGRSVPDRGGRRRGRYLQGAG